MLDMEEPVISDNLSLIEEKVRGIAEEIWGYNEIGEGERAVEIMRGVLKTAGVGEIGEGIVAKEMT